jgi:mannose/fructose/N-acetylgalactosamine-specific phosphotransferase system component IIB
MQPPLEAKATLERAPIMDKKVQELWAVEQQFKQLTEIRNLQVGHMAMADNDKKIQELWEVEQQIKKFTEIRNLQRQLVQMQMLKNMIPTGLPMGKNSVPLGSSFSDAQV